MVNKTLQNISTQLINRHIEGLIISYVGAVAIDLIVPFDKVIIVSDAAFASGYNLKIIGYSTSNSFYCKICY